MFNANKLRAKIVENGYTSDRLAPLLGISKQSMSAKMNGHRDFNAREIQAIKETLNLNQVELCDIFFA